MDDLPPGPLRNQYRRMVIDGENTPTLPDDQVPAASNALRTLLGRDGPAAARALLG